VALAAELQPCARGFFSNGELASDPVYHTQVRVTDHALVFVRLCCARPSIVFLVSEYLISKLTTVFQLKRCCCVNSFEKSKRQAEISSFQKLLGTEARSIGPGVKSTRQVTCRCCTSFLLLRSRHHETIPSDARQADSKAPEREANGRFHRVPT
jgi:hypothetical protein